ncbi:hypothetical protein JZ751_003843 [Albula glossodonta]|uniref:Uncharacterized protein n=1 Tax=Albula glossodonta TaxID=121402 RepID=A0A8T2PGB4_9TELE|nr:hypothetical protein JZ751_003843 [Albula glossodonta]
MARQKEKRSRSFLILSTMLNMQSKECLEKKNNGNLWNLKDCLNWPLERWQQKLFQNCKVIKLGRRTSQPAPQFWRQQNQLMCHQLVMKMKLRWHHHNCKGESKIVQPLCILKWGWRSKEASGSDSSVTRGDRGSKHGELRRFDYTRKKPKTKSKLRILPLSPASSAEEAGIVKERNTVKAVTSPLPAKRKIDFTVPVFGLIPEKRQIVQTQDLPGVGLKPRRLFPESPLEGSTEGKTTFPEDAESETEMGSGVTAAFQTFKNQLREHFSKVESRSLESLSDCQKNVTTLLSTVHSHRYKTSAVYATVLLYSVRQGETSTS